MLLKVKPDGPVYEVHFTSQLITASDNISTTQLQTDAASRTSTSGMITAASVTSVTCNARPIVSSLPSVNSAHVLCVAAAVSDGSRSVKSDTGCTQQTRMSSLAFHHSQPASDGRLKGHAAAETTTTSSSLHNTGTLENFVATGNTIHSDAAVCRRWAHLFLDY